MQDKEMNKTAEVVINQAEMVRNQGRNTLKAMCITFRFAF